MSRPKRRMFRALRGLRRRRQLVPLGPVVRPRPGRDRPPHRRRAQTRRHRDLPRIYRLRDVADDAAPPLARAVSQPGRAELARQRRRAGHRAVAAEVARRCRLRDRQTRMLADIITPADETWQWPRSFMATGSERLHELGYVKADEVEAMSRLLDEPPAGCAHADPAGRRGHRTQALAEPLFRFPTAPVLCSTSADAG